MPEPNNTPNKSRALTEYNPHANIVVPSKQAERFSEKYHDLNVAAVRNNEQLSSDIDRLQHKTVFVYCALCSGKLNRKHGKDKEVDIGYNIKMNIQRWSCSVCRAGFVGYLPNITHESNPELRAEVVEYP